MTKATCTRRNFLSMLAIGAAGVAGSAALAACAQDEAVTASGTASGNATAPIDVERVELANTALAIDTAAWNYDAAAATTAIPSPAARLGASRT